MSKKLRNSKGLVESATKLKKDGASIAGKNSLTLKSKLKNKLAGSQFRWLNELLYTTTGESAFNVFHTKPDLIKLYHEGFRSQAEQWPLNPLDHITKVLAQLPSGSVIADMGCGDAQLAHRLSLLKKGYKVHSFDLGNALNSEHITVCDIAHTPLKDRECGVVVFCLSLMGTNWSEFITEANRVLKLGGVLYIAEVVSRIVDNRKFADMVQSVGFKLQSEQQLGKMFAFFHFKKVANAKYTGKKSGCGEILKPCVYKKR